jgi:biotin carboxylase
MAEFNGERLLILGAGVMQGPAIAIARSMGLYTVAVDGDPKAPGAAAANRFECIDLKDKEGIEALGRSLKAGGGLGGVMTAGTDFTATVAWVAEKVGLPGIPYEAALNASDKERMRRCFTAAGVPSPGFVTVTHTSPGSVQKLPFDYPAVVKPVDNMGGRGCRRVNSPEELADALPEALKFSRSGRAIVEEFMDGPEFSVDAIVYKDEITICGFADRHIFFPPYFIEMGHTMPSSLGPKETGALLEAFTAGVRALGITAGAGAAKGDLKLSSKGPMIGEIAARLSGGYMSGWTFPYASGVEVTRGAILAAMGRVPSGLYPLRNWTCAERAFISIPGTVRSIHGLSQARKTEYVKDLFLRIGEGIQVRFPENNVTKCGNIIAAAPSRDAARTAAESAVRSVLIRLAASQAETEDFLAGPAAGRDPAFPPDAYNLPPELRSALDRLPNPDSAAENHTAGAVPSDPPDIRLLSFREFTESGLRDYVGRTVEESLAAVRSLTGLPLPLREAGPEEFSGKGLLLGRRFWAALAKGGYQGAAYVIDTIMQTFSRQGEQHRS